MTVNLGTTQSLPIDKLSRLSTKIVSLSIIYHPNKNRIGERALLSTLHKGDHSILSRLEPVFVAPEQPSLDQGIPLADPFVSRQGISIGLDEEMLTFTRHVKSPSLSINNIPCEEQYIIPVKRLSQGVVLHLAERIVLLMHWSFGLGGSSQSAEMIVNTGLQNLIGQSEAMHEVRKAIRKIGPLDTSVLIRGESGTGKELVAFAIHQQSGRKDRPLITVNMSAITLSLASAELFGSVRGAYSGAVKSRQGFFQQAQNSTLFMDEIGDAPKDIQIQLLRALESGEIQPVGGPTEKVDVRVIAATDAELESKIADNSFSKALQHRLSHYEIDLPALRYRKEDIGLLMRYFFQQEAQKLDIDDLLLKAESNPLLARQLANFFTQFCCYDWPGNIRELKHSVHQLVVDNIHNEELHLPKAIYNKLINKISTAEASGVAGEQVDTSIQGNENLQQDAIKPKRKTKDIHKDELLTVLRTNRWDLAATAAYFGISRPALYKLIDRTEGVWRSNDISVEQLLKVKEECKGDITCIVDALCISENAVKRRLRELE